jgi:hypothetical protein
VSGLSNILTLAPGGRPLDTSLGFEARTVLVTNYTSSYVRLTDAPPDIPPWLYGAVVPLPPGLRQARASLIPTVPAVSGPPTPTAGATLTWLDVALPADPGHLLQQAQYGVATVLDRFDTSLLATKTYTLPGGTASVGVGIDLNETTPGVSDPAHSVIPASITLTGLPSGANYLLFVPNAALRQQFWAAVNPEDTRLNITIDGVHVNGCFVDILTSPLVIAGQGGDQLGNLAVTLAESKPAPWQAPSKVAAFSFALGASATSVIIAAVAGQTVYLHDLDYVVSTVVANSFLTWQDTAAVAVSQDGTDVAASLGVRPYRFSGLPLTSGRGFQVTNPGGAAGGTARGHVTYSQA